MGFADSLKKNIDNRFKEVASKIVEVFQVTGGVVVSFSPTQPGAPHAKGEFINNWFPMLNGESSDTTSTFDFSGTGSLSRIQNFGQTAEVYFSKGKDGYMTLSNNVDYAYLVEYSGWPSGKPPYAPIRNSIPVVVTMFKK